MKRTQIVLMTMVLLAFAATSFFIFPQADDFSYIERAFNLGFLGAQKSEYVNWTGRYAATAILSISPLLWGNIFHYRLLPILLMTLIYFSSVFMVKQVLASKLKSNEEYFWGLALTFLCITGFHTISEGLYWLASTYTYTIAIVFFNLAFGLVWAEHKSTVKYVFASLAGFVLVGCNETSMVLWLYALSVTGFLSWMENKKIPKGLIFTFVISFIGALIMLKAPGNAVRASHFPKAHNVVRTVSNALLYSFIDPFKFLTLPLIVFTFLNYKRLGELINVSRWRDQKKLIGLIMMGLFFISFAPSLWGMGRRPNTRTMNVIVHCYLLLFFPVVLLWMKSKWFERSWIRYTIALMVISVPTITLVKDYLSGGIQSYHKLWEENMKTFGETYYSKSEAPKSIHFDFIEGINPDGQRAFRTFRESNPSFYQ